MAIGFVLVLRVQGQKTFGDVAGKGRCFGAPTRRGVAGGAVFLSDRQAANLPAGYPKQNEFQSIGTVDSIMSRQKLIVINDQEYILPENIIIVTPGKKNSRLRDVRLGRTAGIFFTEGSETSMPKVTEIWVLPRNFVVK